MFGRLVPILAFLGLAACTPPQPSAYQPATAGGWGYSELWREDGSVDVRFAGNPTTPRETVETYALYRAAELTRITGGDRFVVEDKTVVRNEETYVDYWPTPGFPSFGRRHHLPPHHAAFPERYSRQFFVAELRIRILQPDDPPHPEARDAEAVLNRLGVTR